MYELNFSEVKLINILNIFEALLTNKIAPAANKNSMEGKN
jgi:hypothetical protein